MCTANGRSVKLVLTAHLLQLTYCKLNGLHALQA